MRALITGIIPVVPIAAKSLAFIRTPDIPTLSVATAGIAATITTARIAATPTTAGIAATITTAGVATTITAAGIATAIAPRHTTIVAVIPIAMRKAHAVIIVRAVMTMVMVVMGNPHLVVTKTPIGLRIGLVSFFEAGRYLSVCQ
jgi:hypothetical protein